MDTTRRGFMGLLAAFGLVPALPVEVLAAETAPILTARPAKLGMWVRPFAGGEWRFVGALQSLSAMPERQQINLNTDIAYRIEAELDGIYPGFDFVGERLSLRYTMRLEDGEHELLVPDAFIEKEHRGRVPDGRRRSF